jgi:hypothetical protein
VLKSTITYATIGLVTGATGGLLVGSWGMPYSTGLSIPGYILVGGILGLVTGLAGGLVAGLIEVYW